MKRTLAAVLGLIIVFLFCACQPTPEQAVVVQKDSDRLIEDAQKDIEESADNSTDSSTAESLQKQYGIPETYQFEAQGADGLLNIAVDAVVNVPQVCAMPIYRVMKAEFAQETVSAFFQALCGDAEMYINSGQRTKDQIRDQIVNVRKRIADIKDDPQMAEELAFAEEFLPKLEKELETAPETIVEERTYGELIEVADTEAADNSAAVEEGAEEESTEAIVISTNTTYTSLNAYERDDEGINHVGRTFNVQNRDDSSVIRYSDCCNPAAGVNFGSSASFAILEDTDVDAEILSEIGLAPSEAKQMVQELLDNTGSGMVVGSIYLQDDEQFGNYDDIVRPAEQYAYKVYCVRTVDGLPCSYVSGGSESVDGDMMAPYWHYEGLEFMVNGDGIFSIYWSTPIEVIETVSEDAQLKPFAEIQEIFEKMMGIKYEPQAEYGGNEYDFEINRVTLSLHRIVEQDSNETGLLVPAWNFYGKLTIASDGPTGQYEELGESFMTINAIDGSVIDTRKGY